MNPAGSYNPAPSLLLSTAENHEYATASVKGGTAIIPRHTVVIKDTTGRVKIWNGTDANPWGVTMHEVDASELDAANAEQVTLVIAGSLRADRVMIGAAGSQAAINATQAGAAGWRYLNMNPPALMM